MTVSIADTGVGMSEDVLARAFEPFFTTKEVGKGSGLGLAQVYGFLAQSNGQVSIESAPGKGTTVSLTFPRSEKPVADDRSAMTRTSAPHSVGRARRRSRTRANVLLVEDDLTVAGLTTQMLESIGMSVVHVKSAAAALDALAEARDVDVVFSDVMMPGGMSGVELAREIRKRRPRPACRADDRLYRSGEVRGDGRTGSAGQAVSTRGAVPHPDCEPFAARRRGALAAELRTRARRRPRRQAPSGEVRDPRA